MISKTKQFYTPFYTYSSISNGQSFDGQSFRPTLSI